MIQEMRRVYIAARQGDRQAVLAALFAAGVVHVEPARPDAVKPPAELAHDLTRGEKALQAIDAVEPAVDAVAAPPGTPARLIDEVHAQLVLIERLHTDRQELERELAQVKPWGRISQPDLEKLAVAGLTVRFCLCPPAYVAESISADIIQGISVTDGVLAVLAVGRGPVEVRPPAQMVPTPPRDAPEIEAALATLREEERRLSGQLRELAMRREDVRSYLVELKERISFQTVEAGLAEEGPVFVMQGWVPENRVEALHTALEGTRLPVGVVAQVPADDEAPPTAFSNSPWVRPVECLFTLLGVTPGYREADISPAFLPFLTIFTAMLIADAGYGIVAFVALLAARKPLISRGVPEQVLTLFTILFAGVAGWGVLTNAWFGAPLMNKSLLLTGDQSKDELFLKQMCFLIGAVHLTIAHVWKIRRAALGLPMIAEAGWVLFIWAMWALVEVLVNGSPAPSWMLPLFGVSLFMIVLFTDFSWNLFAAVGKGLGAVALNAASFLGDIISYIRLWAVGLAGGVLAASFNEMVRPLPLLLVVVILVAAHMLNFALGLVAIFAHGVRLNLLEFSNHLGMEWTGRGYDPFGKK
ncbi:MAG: V-type ATP synthase subunit I [bacterium ADurb.Bin374]|nr:MAG: V-type ATP synthase subunit I [bacterium ADurb.Bin374]